MQPEHRTRFDRSIVEKQIVAMQVDRHVQRPLRGADAGDVIDMRVGQENVANRQAVSFGKGEQVAHAVAGIDDHRLA